MGNSCCVPLRSKFRNPDEIYVTNIDELAGWREADEIDSEELETWPTQVVTGSVVTKNQNRFSDSISEIDLASIGITAKFLSKYKLLVNHHIPTHLTYFLLVDAHQTPDAGL